MNITWIIGNGFDLNLGLKTGYDDFYSRWYSALDDSEVASHRAVLEQISGQLGGSRAYWSDLEVFLGESTVGFADVDEHYDCFYRMRCEMETYLEGQQGRFDASAQPDAFLDELFDSLVGPLYRLDDDDRGGIFRQYGLYADDRFSADEVRAITLNYTNCLDGAIAERFRRHIPERFPDDSISFEIIHPHGLLDDRRQIVFGVADAEQVANKGFRTDAEFPRWWTKPGIDAVYGNHKLDQALEAIKDADLIVSFGCSFGTTDAHLWSAVGRRMAASPRVCFVSFERSLPEKSNPREHLRRANSAKQRLAQLFGLPGAGLGGVVNVGHVGSRIAVAPSSRVFSFGGEKTPELNADPIELEEIRRAVISNPHM